METAELRRRFASSPVARLSTVRPDGGPHVVPIVFALVGDTVFSAVDAKPKRSTAPPAAGERAGRAPRARSSWTTTRTTGAGCGGCAPTGAATVVDAPPAEHPGIQALVRRFPQYRDEPPSGPLLVVTVQRWTGWTSTS